MPAKRKQVSSEEEDESDDGDYKPQKKKGSAAAPAKGKAAAPARGKPAPKGSPGSASESEEEEESTGGSEDASEEEASETGSEGDVEEEVVPVVRKRTAAASAPKRGAPAAAAPPAAAAAAAVKEEATAALAAVKTAVNEEDAAAGISTAGVKVEVKEAVAAAAGPSAAVMKTEVKVEAAAAGPSAAATVKKEVKVEALPKAAAAATAGDSDDDDVKPVTKKAAVTKRATPAAKPGKAAAGPVVDDMGWTIVAPSLFWKNIGDVKPSAKIACFDMDGTLVNTKGGRTFATNKDDWRWFNKTVVETVKSQRAKGWKIVVFSNQGGVKSALTGKAAGTSKGKAEGFAKELGPCQVFMATMSDEFRKPGTGMWKYMLEHCNGGIAPDLASCSFVGDAAGRPEDFSNSDRELAAAIGITFHTPEEVFGRMEGKRSIPQGAAAALGDACVCPGNQALVTAFRALAVAFFEHKEIEKSGFKGAAARKASTSLASYGVRLTLDNYKEAKKLPGVGDGSVKMILEFLESGKLQALEDITGDGTGATKGDGGSGTPAAAAGAAAISRAPVSAAAAAMQAQQTERAEQSLRFA